MSLTYTLEYPQYTVNTTYKHVTGVKFTKSNSTLTEWLFHMMMIKKENWAKFERGQNQIRLKGIYFKVKFNFTIKKYQISQG